MGAKLFGARVKRLEDPLLLTGRGEYTDDILLDECLHAVFVRSPFAHAKFTKIEKELAESLPGVHAVLTLCDFPSDVQDNTLILLLPNPAIKQPLMPHLLAKNETTFCGQAVAVVIADSRHIAEDAAALVDVDWDPLPAASDVKDSLQVGAAKAHENSPDNVAAFFKNEYGDVDTAFSNAHCIVSEKIKHHRGGGHSMEARGVLAVHNIDEGRTQVWSSTQTPHQVKRCIIGVLGWDENELDVIAPDVGGGFGPKAMFYSEEAVIPFAARKLGRPVKWVEDRREHFLCASQERDQYWEVEAAFDDNGRLSGVRGTMIHDTGSYIPWGIVSPLISATTVPGPYILPNYRMETTVGFTNKIHVTPVRGAGRPQAVLTMERLMDKGAKALGLDAAELRRRNLIPKEWMPYKVGLVFRDGKPVTYDSGDYLRAQAEALEKIDYAGFPARQAVALSEGRYIGIGIGNYVEGTGLGPFEGATVRIGASGKIFVISGAAPQGQGHKTTMAQIAAEKFGVDVDDVEVVLADTSRIAHGVGTFASRIAANAMPSVHLAALEVRQKAIKAASYLLEAAEEDIEIEAGKVFVKGVEKLSMSLAQLAHKVAGSPGFALPEEIEPGLEATNYFSPAQSAYCNGCHVAEVEVDIETGKIDILRYVISHDAGNLINPLIVDGQVQGGLAHGVGNALYEALYFDDEAIPLTTNFGEYILPAAENVPNAECIHIESPSPLNPLGVKGAGEGGTIPAAATILAAVENALTPFNIHLTNIPIRPDYLVSEIAKSRAL